MDILDTIDLKNVRGICRSALRKWGAVHQLNKCKEELLELLTELNRFEAGKSDEDKIIDEVVDVIITAMQLGVLMGVEKTVQRFHFKIQRLDKLISHK